MSGAGAGALVRVFIAFALSYRGAGRPLRWLVTIAGEPFSSVASATNSSATSTEPTTAKKARTGIGAAAQKERPFRINRPKKMAVSDRPNTRVVLYSFVLKTCAVARSF